MSPGFSTYSMTKHAVVALSEALYLDLAAEQIGNIGVTIVMPGMSQSDIMNPGKTGPLTLQAELRARLDNRNLDALERHMRAGVKAGLPADELARTVFDAIAAGALYVLPAFMDEASQATAKAVGSGRATGTNPSTQRFYESCSLRSATRRGELLRAKGPTGQVYTKLDASRAFDPHLALAGPAT